MTEQRGFTTCCSVFVVPSVSVESAMECQIRVHDVFFAVSLSGTMRSAISVLLEENASVIFLMLMPLGCQLPDREKFLCGADHSRGENTCKHLGFEESDAVVR